MQGETAAEWKQCHAASLLIGKKGSEMANQMQQSACALVMEFVPGTALFHVQQPFGLQRLEQTAADLGRYGHAEQGLHYVLSDVNVTTGPPPPSPGHPPSLPPCLMVAHWLMLL